LKAIVVAAAVLLSGGAGAPAYSAEPDLTPEQQATLTKWRAIYKDEHPQTGEVSVPEAKAVLHLGKDYYFLGSAEAKRMLTEGWGNPVSEVSDVLGVVLPAGKTFADDTWGAVVTYNPTLYVADGDASSADYDKMLKDTQEAEVAENEARTKQGLQTIHLVGWAQPPSYDKAGHYLVWARDLRFGDGATDTLNYDIRQLGRHGTLSLNMVSRMDKLAEIRTAAQALARTADFEAGSRYADYDPKTDKKAQYGVAGLVAAGLGLVVAKKIGLIAVGLLFFKKIAVFLLVAFGGIAAKFRGLFRKKPDTGPLP
jgi:uncharacterized membrane-anchored protein